MKDTVGTLSRLAALIASDPRPDAHALHLACASEGGNRLVSNDARLIEAARAHGCAVETP